MKMIWTHSSLQMLQSPLGTETGISVIQTAFFPRDPTSILYDFLQMKDKTTWIKRSHEFLDSSNNTVS